MFSWAKIKLWAGIAAGVFVAGVVAFAAAMRGARRDGINQVLVEQQERRDELQEAYDEIDSRPVDVDSAYAGLRELSDDKRRR